MRVRIFNIIATLIALALIPSTALAAPKKAQVKFSASAYSVAENAGTFNLVIQRSGNTATTASANLQIDSSSTAVGGGVDYTYTGPSSVTFNPGEVSKTFPVTIVDNQTADAPNKKIVFTLSGASPAGTQLKNSPATVTIIDNEGPGTLNLSSNAYSVVEGAGTATITVNRLGASNLALSVDYATQTAATSPATPTADYTPISPARTLTFAPGEMSKTFQVSIADDGTPESSENVNVILVPGSAKNLSGAVPPQIGPNSPAVLTIADDDTYSFTSSLYSVNENDSSGHATVTVSRGGSPNVPATVNFSTSNGTAVAPGDYTATNVPVNFAVGETTKTVDIPIVNDSSAEGTESVNLRLSIGATTLATSLLTIVDNDNPKGSVQLADVAYNLTEGAGAVATVTVTLSHAVDADVTVDYATSDGTASAGSDYTATSGTLTFKGNLSNGGNGETRKTISVPVANDSVPSDSRTFNVTLSNVAPSSAAVAGAPATAVVTILDDDPPGDVQFKMVSYEVDENAGHATVEVERVGGTSGTVAVDYATSDGSATAGADYSATNGTLTFNPGDSSETFDVPIVWDGQAEGVDETINLSLSNPTGGADVAANDAAVIYIADDGASGPTRLSADSYKVDESAGMVTITVTRSGGSLGGPVSVDYATGDGTATTDADYTAASGTLTFGPGEATKSFTVPISNDSVYEGSETFQVTLSNSTGGASVGSPSGATVTIADDEPAPSQTQTQTPSQTQTSTQDQSEDQSPNLQSTPANPNPEGSQTAALDKRAPRVSLSIKKIQKAFKVKQLALFAKCDENCKLTVVAKTAKGKKAITIGKANVKTARGVKAQIKVKLSKRALAKLTKLIKRGKVAVTLSVVASDAAGNKGKAGRGITIKR